VSRMVVVSFCCNDDYGTFTGKVIRFDCQEYELECEDTWWPPRGVKFEYRTFGDLQGFEIRLGRDIWRRAWGGAYGGNIFWRTFQVAGVDALGMMNYLMRNKYWHATAGECYLYDQFNAKRPIVPGEFFKSREAS
jgi:hypothetical protein